MPRRAAARTAVSLSHIAAVATIGNQQTEVASFHEFAKTREYVFVTSLASALQRIKEKLHAWRRVRRLQSIVCINDRI